MVKIAARGGKSGDQFVKPKAPPRATTRAQVPEVGEFTLPDGDLEDPVLSFDQTKTLFHGEYKTGKTLTAMESPDALLLAFEPGGSAISPNRQREITNWNAFLQYKKLLKASDRFATVVVDTVDVAYDMCFKQICKNLAVDHPSEGNFGDVWDTIRKEFHDQMTDLMRLGRGVIFISHTETAEFQGRTGGTYNKLIPSMGKRPREFITAVADNTIFFGYHGTERLMTIQGSDELEAGSRLKNNFWVKDQFKIQRVHSIPMGASEVESYRNLVAAFNNEQETDGTPEHEGIVLAETRVKKQATGRRR